MKQICITLLLFAFIGSSYGQITSIHLQSIESGVYTGTVNPADFPTHNFSGETIEMNSNGASEVWPQLLFLNLTQTALNWTISRRRIGVDASWNDFMIFGESNNLFGGIAIDALSMDIDLWLGTALTEQPVGISGSLYLVPHIFPNSSTGGCGRYRYYLGTAADPFQDSVDIQVCYNVGIDDLNQSEVTISPNPASDHFKISSESALELNYSFSNSLGQVIDSGVFINNHLVETSEFDNGIYFVKVTNGTVGLKTERIIINH
jgi:hypothetical protein